jgi:hypothetical protein
VCTASILTGSIAVPAGFWFAGIAVLLLAVVGAAVLFLPLFVFLSRLIRYAMRVDTDAVLDAFGKNEQVKRLFWTGFVATDGLVLARVVDPVTAQQVVGMITGRGRLSRGSGGIDVKDWNFNYESNLICGSDIPVSFKT